METENNPPIQEVNIHSSNLKKYFVAMLVFLVPMAVVLLTYPETKEQKKNNTGVLVKIKKPFPKIDILAKTAYVWDVKNGKPIYVKNEKEQVPLASLTKVMTALVALDEKDGSEKIKITSDSIKQEGDSGLANEENWKLKDLIDFSLITSSNDGMYAVASEIERATVSSASEITGEQESQSNNNQHHDNFIKLMNKKAKEISLDSTFYLNETGLDFDNKSGGYGSAEDMAKLFSYIIKNNPETLEATAYGEIQLKSLNDLSHKAKNTNDIIEIIPNLIASKTGYTDISGGNLAIAFDFGLMRPIVITVLGSTREGRFEDMIKLIEATMVYLADEDIKN